MISSDSSDSSSPRSSPKVDYYPRQQEEKAVTLNVEERVGLGKTRPEKQVDEKTHDGEWQPANELQNEIYSSAALSRIRSITCSIDDFIPAEEEDLISDSEDASVSRTNYSKLEAGNEIENSSYEDATPTSSRESLGTVSEGRAKPASEISLPEPQSHPESFSRSSSHRSILQRQVDVQRAKIRKNPLLKLLDSHNVDINAYYLGDNYVKQSRFHPSPKSRKGSNLSQDFVNPMFKREETLNPDPSAAYASGYPAANGEQIDENDQEANAISESSQFQKEDTLLWCHQQILAAKVNKDDSTETSQGTENPEYQFFHSVVLSDAANTPAQIAATAEFRDADRITPPEELDEILTILSCAAKVYIAEIMASAQYSQLAERRQVEANAMKRKEDAQNRFGVTHSQMGSHKNFFNQQHADNESLILPKHIYDAVRRVKFGD